MGIYSYYREHERECELAFHRSTLDRPVALPALVYAYVHRDRGAVEEMLARAPKHVRRFYQKLLTPEPGNGEESAS